MSVIGDKINWMRQTRSVASMSRETGIATRTIFAIERGNYVPNSEQLSTLNSLYGRESYSRLRLAGVPQRQALSVRGGSLLKVSNLERETFWIVEQFTKGALLKTLDIDILSMPDTRKWNNTFLSMYDKIVDGLSESYKTIDEIWREKKS